MGSAALPQWQQEVVGEAREMKARYLAYALAKGVAPVTLWRFLAKRRGYPEPEMRLLRRLVRPGTAVIDVGASGGQYALHLAALGVASLLFEPRAAAAAGDTAA